MSLPSSQPPSQIPVTQEQRQEYRQQYANYGNAAAGLYDQYSKLKKEADKLKDKYSGAKQGISYYETEIEKRQQRLATIEEQYRTGQISRTVYLDWIYNPIKEKSYLEDKLRESRNIVNKYESGNYEQRLADLQTQADYMLSMSRAYEAAARGDAPPPTSTAIYGNFNVTPAPAAPVPATEPEPVISESYTTQNSPEPVDKELQKQAESKLFYEALSEATKEVQQAGGGTVTAEKIQAEALNLLEGKYSEGVPVVDKKAQAEAEKAAYAVFKGQQVIDSASKGDPSAFGLTDADVKALEKVGIEGGKEVQQLSSEVADYSRAKVAEEKINKAIDEINAGKPLATEITQKDIAALEKAGVQDAKHIVDELMYAGGKGGQSDMGILAPVLGKPLVYEARDDRGNITERLMIPRVDLKEDLMVKDVPKPTGNILEDFGKGAAAVGENIVTAFRTIPAGLQETWDPKTRIRKTEEQKSLLEAGYKPEPESDIISIGVQAAKEAITSGQVKTDVGKELSKVGENIFANPAYAVGAIIASAATWLGPQAATKAVKITQAARAQRAAEQALKPFIGAGMKLEKPVVITVEKPFINIGFESDITRYGTGMIKTGKGGKVEIELAHRQPITSGKTKDFIVDPSKTTGYATTVAELESGDFPVKALKQLTPKQSELLIKKTELYAKGKPIAFAAKSGPFKGEVFEKVDDVLLKVKQKPEVVMTTERFSAKELLELGSTEAGIKKFFGTSDDLLRVSKGEKGSGTGSMKPLLSQEQQKQVLQQSSKIESAPAKSAGEAAKISAAIAAGKFTVPTVAGESTYSNISGIGIGGNVADYSNVGSLGLGGLTGAERKVKRLSEESVYERLSYPELRELSIDAYNQDFINRVNNLTDSVLKNMSSLREIPSTTQKPIDLSGLERMTSLRTDQTLNTKLESQIRQDQAHMQRAIQTTMQTTIMRTDVPEIKTPKPPLRPFPDLNSFYFGKKRRKKKDDFDYGERIWTVPSLFGSGFEPLNPEY